MPLFVHMTPEKTAVRIRRNGIRTSRGSRCVFAMPVTPDFFISHQWLRELKGSGQRTIASVYFRIPREEEVLVGHYLKPPLKMSAGEAIRVIRTAPDARGFQVLIPRRILPKEIVRIRTLQQGIGWRYWPDAHGRTPCPCLLCQKGRIKSRRLRDQEDAGGTRSTT